MSKARRWCKATVFEMGKPREIQVTVDPEVGTIEVRAKGLRVKYSVSVPTLYWLLAKGQVNGH